MPQESLLYPLVHTWVKKKDSDLQGTEKQLFPTLEYIFH